MDEMDLWGTLNKHANIWRHLCVFLVYVLYLFYLSTLFTHGSLAVLLQGQHVHTYV